MKTRSVFADCVSVCIPSPRYSFQGVRRLAWHIVISLFCCSWKNWCNKAEKNWAAGNAFEFTSKCVLQNRFYNWWQRSFDFFYNKVSFQAKLRNSSFTLMIATYFIACIFFHAVNKQHTIWTNESSITFTVFFLIIIHFYDNNTLFTLFVLWRKNTHIFLLL